MKVLNSLDGSKRIITDANNRFITDAQLSKLAGIETGAQVNVGTNLGITGTGNSRSITSSTGTSASIPVATTSTAGFFSTTDKTKLNGIATGAEVNQNAFSNVASTGKTTVSSASKTGTLSIEAGSSNVVISTDNSTKTVSIDFVGGTYEYAAGNGLTLSGLTFAVGTPSTITGTSTNSVTTSSHNHAISLNHSDLGGIGENDHHSRAHSMTSALDHGNIAANTIIGRESTTGTPQELTAIQVRSIINVASGAEPNQTISSGSGMNFTGGTGNVTITMGTPTGLTASTTNALTATSHTHSIATATAVGLSNASVSGAGTSTSLARADHTHSITGFSLDTHNHTLDSLSNVTISSIASGEILKWNGTAWINNTLAEAGIQPAGSYLTTSSSFGGDVSGTYNNIVVADDSHNHIISNVDGLQTALDGKQPLDDDLTKIAGLTGTTGLLKKTAANTWTLDTTGYTTNAGTVTSVAMSVPTGLSVSGSPITTSGTLAITLTSGYSIPTTVKQGQWDIAYANTHTSGSDNQTITSGNGMNFTSGNGNVTVALGTPSTLTASTTNSLSTTSHTHAITGFTKTTVPAVAGNLASLLLDGNLADSGISFAFDTNGFLVCSIETGA